MIENTKCECGHNNPTGTVLCEYCGKPLEESVEQKKIIDKEMRYEGMARRSQTYRSSPVDQIWNFFSSVKVAVFLIITTLIVSAIGTLFPQEQFIASNNPEVYYENQYGFWGKWFYQFGFSKMYTSWWFVTLISLIGVSLVICSLDRAIPLYKALKNQKVVKSRQFIQRQRFSTSRKLDSDEANQMLDELKNQLHKKRYKVIRENDSLLAEKGRISRWGPYINHIGLIILLFGILLHWLPGWNIDEYVWVREGEIKKVPQTDYYVKNIKSVMELYDRNPKQQEVNFNQSIVKKYQTDAILYQKDASGKLQPVHRHAILVNQPLNYQGIKLYQSDFRPAELAGIEFQVLDKEQKQSIGKFSVNLSDISYENQYQVGDLQIRITEYYPDFALEDNQPVTKSQEPNRPAFIFEVKKKGEQKVERSWVISGINFANPAENQYDINFAGLKTVSSSGLMVRMDRSLPIYLVGGIIFLIGVTFGFYWQHRRIWIRYQDGTLYVGAHTNKNWFSLKRELQQIGEKVNFGGDKKWNQ